MDRIEEITGVLNDVITPLAILSLTFIAAVYIVSPAAQEWMMERRGMMGRVLFGLILFPAVTNIVELFVG